MIFVTVATQSYGFERLIKEMDKIASKIDEEVIAQIGYTKYIPKYMKYFTFTDKNKILELYEKSRIIITHAGAGTILTLFNYKKPLIIVPRLKKFDEHIDNHQLELAEALKNHKNFFVVYDINDLERTIKKAAQFDYFEIKPNNVLVNFLKDYLEKMDK